MPGSAPSPSESCGRRSIMSSSIVEMFRSRLASVSAAFWGDVRGRRRRVSAHARRTPGCRPPSPRAPSARDRTSSPHTTTTRLPRISDRRPSARPRLTHAALQQELARPAQDAAREHLLAHRVRGDARDAHAAHRALPDRVRLDLRHAHVVRVPDEAREAELGRAVRGVRAQERAAARAEVVERLEEEAEVELAVARDAREEGAAQRLERRPWVLGEESAS